MSKPLLLWHQHTVNSLDTPACLTVAGPGATNLATGLYDASLDHSPVLALTGMLTRQLIGPGSFQEIDQQAFFEPITVYNKVLMSENQTTTLITKLLNMLFWIRE